MVQYLKGNNMTHIKIHNGGYYAYAQTSNAYNFCLSWNSTKFIRTFMGQYLKGNNMAPKKIIMAVMRMRKFLIIITQIWVKMQLGF